MFFYILYGMRIKSDLEFPQLVCCEACEDYDVLIERDEKFQMEIHFKKDEAFRFGREYSWLNNKTCQIEVFDGKRITYALTGGGWPQHLQTYILGYGFSMLALQRDKLPIHCSALSDGDGAILIAGESGAGKSTITNYLLQNGYRLMADDMALADGEIVYPAFPYQKLCRDAALDAGYDLDELIYIDEDKDKFLAPYKGEFSAEARRIKCFILLRVVNGENVVDTEVEGLGRFHIFASNLFVRHLIGNGKYEPHIGQKCLEMASKVPVYVIGRPDGLDTTAEVVQKATQWVASLGKTN